MTRFPTETRQIQGLEGEDFQPYDLPTSICANPECEYEATDRHHLFSRGLMGGAYDWVVLPDGTISGNILGLCYLCHKKVTENKAHIHYDQGKFWWNENELRYQPPRDNSSGEDTPTTEGRVAAASSPGATPVCPTCKRKIPKPKVKSKSEEKKPRKTWSVAVPYDVQEDGADVIDQLIDICEEKMDKYGLNWGHGHRVVYYKLTSVLALFAQHADEILSDT